jgi:hypothetical protein
MLSTSHRGRGRSDVAGKLKFTPRFFKFSGPPSHLGRLSPKSIAQSEASSKIAPLHLPSRARLPPQGTKNAFSPSDFSTYATDRRAFLVPPQDQGKPDGPTLHRKAHTLQKTLVGTTIFFVLHITRESQSRDLPCNPLAEYQSCSPPLLGRPNADLSKTRFGSGQIGPIGPVPSSFLIGTSLPPHQGISRPDRGKNRSGCRQIVASSLHYPSRAKPSFHGTKS